MTQQTFHLAEEGAPALFLRHRAPAIGGEGRCAPVLYIHGATFPSALSVGFELDGRSWMDDLAESGFSVWALDFAGFGGSERHPEMEREPGRSAPLGRAPEAALQIARAVRFVCGREEATRVSLLAHSWGSMPAALFATREPERVERLVLFAPIVRRPAPAGGDRPETALLGGWRAWSVEDQRARFVSDVPPDHPPLFDARSFEAWGRAYLATDPESGRREPAAVRTPNGPLADILDAWAGSLPYDPARIAAPTLIVRGEWDCTSTDSDVEWLFSALEATPSKRELKLSKGTHFMHLERGRFSLYDATRSFLRAEDEGRAHPSREAPLAVIFEVRPRPEQRRDYLDIAARLRPELEKIDGFISIERFTSLSEEGKILSLSFWRDEEAVAAWRDHAGHRRAQTRGREEIFEDYRLRVAGVLRDYGMSDRREAPGAGSSRQVPGAARLGPWLRNTT